MRSILLTVGALALGCSSTADRPAPEELGDTSDALLIDSVNWNGETLAFYDAAAAGEAPEIMITQMGDNAAPELQTYLSAFAEYPVTAAELWQQATGAAERDVPAALLEQHVTQAALQGRPDARLQAFAGVREKAALNVSFLFPLTSDSTGQPVGGPARCWDNVRLQGAANLIGTTYVCSQDNTTVRSGLVRTHPCVGTLGSNADLRTALVNGTEHTFAATGCFSTSSGPWQCFSPVSVPVNNYFGYTFLTVGSPHNLGIGANVTQASTGQQSGIHSIVYGTAVLGFGLQRFADTTCNGFTQH